MNDIDKYEIQNEFDELQDSYKLELWFSQTMDLINGSDIFSSEKYIYLKNKIYKLYNLLKKIGKLNDIYKKKIILFFKYSVLYCFQCDFNLGFVLVRNYREIKKNVNKQLMEQKNTLYMNNKMAQINRISINKVCESFFCGNRNKYILDQNNFVTNLYFKKSNNIYFHICLINKNFGDLISDFLRLLKNPEENFSISGLHCHKLVNEINFSYIKAYLIRNN